MQEAIAFFQTYTEYNEIDLMRNPDVLDTAYRIMAKRFHTDNRVTGNAEMFHKLNVARKIIQNDGTGVN
jgi:hypothetical protein